METKLLHLLQHLVLSNGKYKQAEDTTHKALVIVVVIVVGEDDAGIGIRVVWYTYRKIEFGVNSANKQKKENKEGLRYNSEYARGVWKGTAVLAL
jgi:hypothetical protein